MTNNIEVVFSFDTTGSMYPCLAQVRRSLAKTVERLFKDIPNIRIGLVAHGDYCDAKQYITKIHPITDDRNSLVRFVQDVSPTNGGDAEECYELVLNEARSLNWTSGKSRVLVMIGDSVPHSVKDNPKHLDWRNEMKVLKEMGVRVYGVQCLGYDGATSFWQTVAAATGGLHLKLDQIGDITDLMHAVAYQQAGRLSKYEEEVKKAGRMTRGMDQIFATLGGRSPNRSYAPPGLEAVHPSRFQLLYVYRDQPIMEFVQDHALRFRPGAGFYEFTKSETIQYNKEVVLMDRTTGDMYTGRVARQMIGLPEGVTARIKPSAFGKYRVFVQSTSTNRKLKAGQGFLYELS